MKKPAAEPPDPSAWGWGPQAVTSLQLLQLFLNSLRVQWEISPLPHDVLLPLLAQNVPQECLDLRLNRLTRRATQDRWNDSRQRIPLIDQVLLGRLVERL